MKKILLLLILFSFNTNLSTAFANIDEAKSKKFFYCFAIILAQNGGAPDLKEDYNQKKYDLSVNYDALIQKGDDKKQYQNFLKGIREQDKIFVKSYFSFLSKAKNFNQDALNKFYLDSYNNFGCNNLIKIKDQNYKFKNLKFAEYSKPLTNNISKKDQDIKNLDEFEKWYSITGLLLIIIPPLLLLMSNRGKNYLDTPEGIKYTGMWVRGLASIVDLIVFTLFVFVISLLVIFFTGDLNKEVFSNYRNSEYGAYLELGYTAIYLLYAGTMQSSKLQATFGMLLFRFKLSDHKFQRVGFFRVILRELTTYLSALLLFIGFLMIAFTKKKQGLHDKIAKTFCVKYPKDFNFENLETKEASQSKEEKDEEEEDADEKPGSKIVTFFVSILAIPIFFIGYFASEYVVETFYNEYDEVIRPLLETTGFYNLIYSVSKGIFIGFISSSVYVAGIKLLYKRSIKGAASIPIIFYFVFIVVTDSMILFSDYVNEFVKIPEYIFEERKEIINLSNEELVGQILYAISALLGFFIIFKNKKEKKEDE